MEKFKTKDENHFIANNQKNALQLVVEMHNILDLLKYNLISIVDIERETDLKIQQYLSVRKALKKEHESTKKIDDNQTSIPVE